MWNVDGMKRWLRRLPFLLVATLLFTCELEDPLALGELVVDEVTGDAIYCHVAVSGMAPDDYGFYYATSKSDVEKNDATKVPGTYSQEAVIGVIEGLKPYTTYYIKAYAMNMFGRRTTQTVAVTTQFGVPGAGDNEFPDIVYSGN